MTTRVLDSSVLIYNPKILNEYPGDDLVITKTVLEELGNISSGHDVKSKSARDVMRRLDEYREEGSIFHGVQRDEGGTLRIELNHIDTDDVDIPKHADINTNDDKIILVTYNLNKDDSDDDVILVTNDRRMSIIAESWGLKTEYHQVKINPLHSGLVIIDNASDDQINDIYGHNGNALIDEEIPVNTGVILKNGSSSALAISDGEGQVYKVDTNISMSNVYPRGGRQIIAANLLMGRTGPFDTGNKEFLGSLCGRAGAGKTLLALSAGIKRVLDNEYDQIIIYRPTEPVGRDLGYLPGSVEEKMKPWTAAIDDIVSELKTKGTVLPEEYISVESSSYVRGRTLRKKWVIIEEAQNYEPVVLRTLLSRAGEGTAVILTWDETQVDNLYLRKNVAEGPMSILSDLIGNRMVWHMELVSPERGGVSSLIN